MRYVLPGMLACAFATGGPAFGQPERPERQPAKASLVSETTGVAPGEKTFIGVLFEIDPGWHLYWDGMNDTGVPPLVKWDAPEGVRIGELQWPSPERYVGPGDLLDHIYEDRLLLMAPVTVSDAYAPGDSIEIGADVSWTVCDEICLFGKGSPTMTLPVVEAGEARPSEAAKRFKETRESFAKELKADDDSVRLAWTGEGLTITASGSSRIAFYPARGGADLVNILEDGESKGESLRLRVEGEGGVTGIVDATLEDGTHLIRWIETKRPE